MAVYLVTFVWSLALFFCYRQLESGARQAGSVRSTPHVWLRSSAATIVGMVAAFVVFLMTPRFGDASWEFTLQTHRLQTGLSDERPSIDLNNKGVVAMNRDLAFEVFAFASDGVSPKIDLDPNQRWRAASFDHYGNGRWDNRSDADHRDRIFSPILGMEQLEGLPPPKPIVEGNGKTGVGGPLPLDTVVPRARTLPKLPNLGPSQVFLRYQPRGRGSNRVLAEPVWRPTEAADGDRRVSVMTIRNDKQIPWIVSPDEYPLPPVTYGSTGGPPATYLQVYLPQTGDAIGPAIPVTDGSRAHLSTIRVPAIKSWTQELVRSLVKAGNLPKSALGANPKVDEPISVPPEHGEEVAKALRTYLVSSGEYTYSLNLERQDDRCDPAEDFLLNTKVGHCQRFATALVLMLRSVGIPARIVLGYHGFETDGLGAYEILQCHAHAWVEALIQRTSEGETTWHWLTLDPTPAGDDAVANGFSFARWFESFRGSFVAFYRYFIVEYDADQQARAGNLIARIDWQATLVGADGTQWWRPVVLVGGVIGLTMFVRRKRKAKRARTAAEPPFDLYARVCGLIRRWIGIEQAANQTPEEFARAAADRLAVQAASGADPNLPAETVVVYYRVRFGRQSLSDNERSAISERIDRFEADLGRRDLRLEPGSG
jgi:protein-glutamine gamma-glutamyltransferase